MSTLQSRVSADVEAILAVTGRAALLSELSATVAFSTDSGISFARSCRSGHRRRSVWFCFTLVAWRSLVAWRVGRRRLADWHPG